MRATCAAARPLIVAYASHPRQMPRMVRAHRDVCLRCQALESRVRLAQRYLPAVGDGVGSGTDLLPSVMARLSEPGSSPAKTMIAPLGAAAAGAAVAVIVVLARRRVTAPA